MRGKKGPIFNNFEKKLILVHAEADGDETYAEQFIDLVLGQPFPVLKNTIFAKSLNSRMPDICMAVCDYHCTGDKCFGKFRFLREWSYLPSIIISPLRYDQCRTCGETYFVRLWGRGEKTTSDFADYLAWLHRASFIACSPSWPIHPKNPLYKAAKVQEIVLDRSQIIQTESVLAKEVGWSVSWLSTVFHREIGITLEQFMIKMRMCHSLRQVANTDKRIKDICDEAGYQDCANFSKLFKRYFGRSASSFRVPGPPKILPIK